MATGFRRANSIFYRVPISVHVLLVQSSGTRPVVHRCNAERTTITLPSNHAPRDLSLICGVKNTSLSISAACARHGRRRILWAWACRRERSFPPPLASACGIPRRPPCDVRPAAGRKSAHRDRRWMVSISCCCGTRHTPFSLISRIVPHEHLHGRLRIAWVQP